MTAPVSSDPQQHAPVFPSPLTPEWGFLQAAVASASPDWLRSLAPQVRWRVLLDLAEHHAVQPLLHRAISAAGSIAPAHEMAVLAQLCQTNLHKAMLMARELIHLVDHLAQEGIDVLAYKGVALAESFYGDIALRPTGDIDLLVHARDLQRIEAAVAELGYVPQSSFSAAQRAASLKSGYECVFDGPLGRNLLELQWAILPRFYAVEIDHEGLFARAVSIKVAGHRMKTPCAEDLFLILCVHAAKHVWGRLIWLCDLARIAAGQELDWQWISEQAKKLGIVRIVRVTLLLIRRVLNADLPATAEFNLPADPEAATLASEVETRMASRIEFDVESVAYFRLMLRLRENQGDRRRFLTRLALTPGPGEWSAIHLPPALFPLYRVVRIWRLAGRFLR